MCGINNTRYGTAPANIVWDVVRGDIAILRVEFLDADEATSWDTSGWSYKATAYDKYGEVLDELDITLENGFVDIVAYPSVTQNWGTKYGLSVADLIFDLEVTIDSNTVWTPIVGSIRVIGDVTPGGLL